MGLLLFILRCLPASWARGLLQLLGRLAFVLGVRRRVALENLAIAFPDLAEPQRRALARANYLHLASCAADFLRSPALSDEELFDLVDSSEWDRVSRELRPGKGLIACTAHFGNFELFGVWAARRGVSLTVLTRRLKGAANAKWVGTRTAAGLKEVHGGMSSLIAAVNRGEALALLIDQNMLPKRAVFAPFCGKLAATTPAPAVIAERTGAPVVLALLVRQPDGRYRVTLEGPFAFERRSADRSQDVLEFTTVLNQRLERHVRAHPEQWFWLHRRWKTRPPGEANAGREPNEQRGAG